MPHSKKILALAVAGALAGALGSTAAEAGDWSNSASYNGFGAASANAASSYNLRDANGNLTMVDGQFTSSSYAQSSGAQTASSGGVGMAGATGGGMGGSGTAYGMATAIGNSLNVVTVGNNNTVIVNSTQTNTGNQTASANLSGH